MLLPLLDFLVLVMLVLVATAISDIAPNLNSCSSSSSCTGDHEAATADAAASNESYDGGALSSV